MRSVYDWAEDRAKLEQVQDKIKGLELRKALSESQQQLQNARSREATASFHAGDFESEKNLAVQKAIEAKRCCLWCILLLVVCFLLVYVVFPPLLKHSKGIQPVELIAFEVCILSLAVIAISSRDTRSSLQKARFAERSYQNAQEKLRQAQSEVAAQERIIHITERDLRDLRQKYRYRRNIREALRKPWDGSCDQAALDKALHQEKILSGFQMTWSSERQACLDSYHMRYECDNYCDSCDYAPCCCCSYCDSWPCQCPDPCRGCGCESCCCCSGCGSWPCECPDVYDSD
eukprot:TRINITY_DN63950_c0_g1_i1.p1 TRINITY_DN63950_c0_g1~~TRINITY_DN63950_c0_g1_i1.p1  ORF type:complete len:289 (+),score=27.52 TRINITY_DN63950_c0_g1_i1:209-1075(+)